MIELTYDYLILITSLITLFNNSSAMSIIYVYKMIHVFY